MPRILVVLLVLAFALPAAAAADGEPRNGRIVFDTVTTSSLESIRADGTGRRQLTHPWSYQGVAPSPDGRSLATAGPDELVLLSARTGDVTERLRMNGQTWLGAAAWSPDGRELAFQTCEKTQFTDIEDCVQFGIYRVRLDGTHLRRVAEGTNPNWSSDSRSLTFVHKVREFDANGNECNGIYVAPRSGGAVRRVLPRRVSCSGDLTTAQPFFAPGDNRVMYPQGDSIWSVRLDGTRRRRVVRVRRGGTVVLARLSPDGRRIVYAASGFNSGAGGLWVTGVRGGQGRRIVDSATSTLGWLPLASR